MLWRSLSLSLPFLSSSHISGFGDGFESIFTWITEGEKEWGQCGPSHTGDILTSHAILLSPALWYLFSVSVCSFPIAAGSNYHRLGLGGLT
jgi:hypothetical protein